LLKRPAGRFCIGAAGLGNRGTLGERLGIIRPFRRLGRQGSAGSGCAHYGEVLYEDLVARPEPVLRRLCEFLELPWSNQLLNHQERAPKRLEEHRARVSLDGSFTVSHAQRLHQQRRTMERPGTGRIGSWRETMSDKEVQRFERVAGKLLIQLGYELQGNS